MRPQHLVIAIGFFGSLATSQAAFTLLDDFESYTLGDITTQSDNWSFSEVSDATVGSESGNQFLVQGGTTNAHTVFNNGSTLIADEAAGTYFFRVYMPVEGSHHGTGISPLETSIHWNSGQAIARFGSSGLSTFIFGYSGDETPGYNRLSDTSTSSAWYNVWLVINNAGVADRTYDVYIQSDDDTAYLEQTQVGTGLEYREHESTSQTSLESLFFRTANNGSLARFDDLYIDSAGENLSNPVPSAPGGDRPIEFTDITVNEAGDITLVWESEPDARYILNYSFDLSSWPEVADTIASGGTSTTYTVLKAEFPLTLDPPRIFFQTALNPAGQ